MRKSKIRLAVFFALICLLFSGVVKSQTAATATWTLNSTTTTSVATTGTITATNAIAGAGLTNAGLAANYANYGYSATKWTTSTSSTNFLGYSITPSAGKAFTLTSLSVDITASVSATYVFDYYVSNASPSVTTIYNNATDLGGAAYAVTATTGTTKTFSGLSILVPDGYTCYLRFYAALGATNTAAILGNKNLIVTGTTTATGAAVPYCLPSAGTQDGISGVTFNTINKTGTGLNSYSDYSGTSTTTTTVLPSASYSLSVYANTGGNYTNYQKVWIDWNGDGSFNTTAGSAGGLGEEYTLGTVTNNTNGLSSLCPLSITVPSASFVGNVRMRVSSRYNGYTTSCATGIDGEFEDYTLIIMAPPTIAINAGNGQTATVGTPVSTLPSVIVKDGSGNPVSGVIVTFAVASGGGSITGASATTNASGIATVGSWILGTTTGTNTITATASGYSGSPVTFTATGTAGAATKIAFTTQPSNGTGGTAFTTQPVVTLQDQYGNTVTGTAQNITVAIQNNPGGGTLSGTATVAVNTATGQATFSGLSIDKTGTGYTLTATGNTVSTTAGVIISSGFNITAGAAVKLAFTTQPGGGTGGTPWAQQPVVTLQDAGGNTVTGTAQNVTLAIQNNAGPGGTLSGTKTVAVNTATGQATFSGLSINKTGTGYTLTATGNTVSTTAGVIVSSGFNITVGPGAQYVVTSSNYTPVVGTSVTITAQLTDAGGNNVSATGATVTWSNTGTGTGGSFSSPTSTVTSGVATVSFTTGTISNSIYAIKALDGSAFTGTSPNITTTADVAAKIAFTTQPGNGTGGTAFTTQPVVTLQDQYGNTVTGSAQNVTVAIQNNPGGGTLSGTATVAVNIVTGKATFSGLSIDKTGTGYTLTATGNTVSTTAGVIISSGFNITVGTAAKLAFTTQPGGGTGGTPWAQQPVVTLQDAGGNTVTGTAQNVTVAIQNNAGPGGTLSGTKTVAVNTATGQATFSGLSINKTGTGYTLTATGNTVSTTAGVIVSSGFNITVGAAFQLAVTTQPAAPSFNGGTLAIQPVVVVQDAGGNTVTTSSASITATQSGGTWTIGGGTNPVTAVNGVATFSGLTASSNGNSAVTATITFTSGGLTQVISNPFIIPAPTYKSQINSVSFGTSPWCVGETRSVTVSVTNIGTATWTDANPDINIGLKWDSDPDFGAAPGNIGRQDAGNLAPGATRTYTFPVVTPVLTSGGLDHLTADVVYEGVAWFRDNTNGVGPGNLKFITPAITISTVPIISSVTATPATICNGGSSNLTVASSALAPTTIVDYDFNSGNSYTTLTPLLAAGISSAVTSAETFATFSGIAVGTGAFMTNTSTTSPLPTDLAIGTNNSSGTNTRSFVFTLTGANLPKYKTFKIYFQAQRSSTGATALNVFYNLNGAGFVNTGESPVTMAPNNGSYSQVTITLPSTVDNPTTSLAFGLALSGGSASGTTRIDNFEVQAVPVTTYSWAGLPSGTAGLPGTAGTDLTTNNSISVSPTATTNYVVTATNANGGGCSDNDNVNVTVNQKSANPSTATASATTTCNGGSTTLTLNGGGGGTGEVIKWYSGSCGGTLVGTGNNLSVSPITSTTYYGRYEDGAPCNYNSLCASITITVNQKSANPTSATASATTICNGGSTILTLNGGSGGTGEVIKWYSGSCGGTPEGTGNNLSVSPTTTTTYYGRYEDGAPCNYNSLCASITIIVNQKSADPTSASASDLTVCSGSPTTLTLNGGGGGTGEVIHWYSGSCGGTLVGTGNNLSVSPTTTTTYYGRYEDGTPCSYNSACASVMITVRPAATVMISGTTTICSGSSATITFTGTPNAAVAFSITDVNGSGDYGINLDPTGTFVLGTGALTNTTTYALQTVEYGDAPACTQTATGSAVVTIDQKSADPISATATFTTICSGSTTDLILNGGGGGDNETIHWYSGSCGGTAVGTGNNLTVSPTTTTTYYGRYEDGAPCSYNSSCQSVTITVRPAATVSITGTTTICSGSSATITFTGTPNAAVAFSITDVNGSGDYGINLDPTGTFVLGTGALTNTTTYTLETVEYGDAPACTQTATGSAVVTVNQQSADPTSATASLTTICNDGSSSTVLTLNGGGGGDNETIHWYSNSCGGTPVGTGNNLTVSPATTTTYYGRYEDGAPCNYNSACASVTITVNQQSANPTSATASSTTICYGSSTNLILNGGGGGTGEVIHWYSGSCGGTPEGTGNNLSVSPTTTTTYYGRYEDGAPCNYNSLCASVTITVTTPPSATISYGGSPYCSNGGTATVTLSGTPATGTYSSTTGLVIDAGSGGVDLGASTAGTYTVTYTVAASGGCAMYSTMASITITAAPSATINYYGSPYCPGTGTATVTRTGTPNGTYTASSSGLSINITTGDVDLSASFSGTYTVTYTIPAAGGCGVYTTTASIVINIDTWNGISSTDWNDAANWSCGAVPTINSDAVIPVVAGYYPSVATVGTPATVHNITISSGASLTVTAQTLQISDSIFNSGVFDVSIGTLEFNGTIPQIIPAGAFTGNKIRNIIISNSISLNGLDSLSGVVSFGAANKTFTTNDNLTLKSNVSRTGSIGVIDNGNAITGNVTVERYIATGTGAFPNHAKSWQLMAVPTVGQTLKQSWMEGATISDIPANGGDYTPGSQGNPVAGYGTMVTSDRTTALADGFDAYTRPGPTVKTFNYLTDGYVGLVNANVSLYDKKGYFVFVRGDRSVYTSTGTADHTILRTKGTLFTPANLPPIDTVRAGKFESIGNPYASPVDMTKISATGGNVNQYFYVWDPRLGGSYNYGAFVTFQFDGTNYEVQTNGGATYPANGTPYNYIQNGQAFFMQATGADGFVTFNEAAKAPNASFTTLFTREGGSGTAGLSGSGARTTSAQSASLRTGLHAVNADGSMGSSVDEVLNQFGDTYSAAVDGLDARKMLNTGENLSVRTTGKLLAIEQRHTIVTNDTVFLNMTGLRAQPYQLSIDAKNLNTVESGFVEDAYTNTRTQLNISGNTQISFTVANVAASYAPDRFRIVFTPLKVLPVTFTSVKAYRHDKDINVEWNVNNERNIKQYDVEKSADGKSFSALAAAKATNNNGGAAVYVIADAKPLNGYNYYRVKTTDVNGAVSYSTIVKVEIGETKHEINIYPNPITDGQIHLQFSNEAAGNYGIRLLNKLGQVIMEKQVTRQDGSSTELIKWNFNLAHGMYNLEVTRPDGTVKNINVMY